MRKIVTFAELILKKKGKGEEIFKFKYPFIIVFLLIGCTKLGKICSKKLYPKKHNFAP